VLGENLPKINVKEQCCHLLTDPPQNDRRFRLNLTGWTVDGLKRTAFYDRVARRRPPQITMKVIHKGRRQDVFRLLRRRRRTGIYRPFYRRTRPDRSFRLRQGASSYAFSEATPTQKTPDFAMSHLRSLNYFGVAPFAFVLDNTKAMSRKPDRYDPIADPVYGEMAGHYHVAFLPARVCKPEDKTVVESAVLQAQRFILARLRNRQFFSLDGINAAIREALNNRPMKEFGGPSRR
jgi:hypothetical protein